MRPKVNSATKRFLFDHVWGLPYHPRTEEAAIQQVSVSPYSDHYRMMLFVLTDLTLDHEPRHEPRDEPRDEPGHEGVLFEREGGWWRAPGLRVLRSRLHLVLVQPARPPVGGEGRRGLTEGSLDLCLAPPGHHHSHHLSLRHPLYHR